MSATKPGPSPSPSQWKRTSPVALTRESFLNLLDGKTPLIKVPHFVSNDVCDKVVDYLMPQFTSYLHATGPAVEKVGLAQFEFQAQSKEDFRNRSGDEKARYFSEAHKLRNLHADLATATSTENLWAKTVAAIAALVPEYDVSVASEPSLADSSNHPPQQYHSGIFRSINGGTPPHCDWCPYDCLTEPWILSRIINQAVFNLYLTNVAGGSTTVYDVQWTPEALEYRDPESYGYARELVDGRAKCEWRPAVGQLCIFNSRNIHEVKPVEKKEDRGGSGKPRIALASFMGLLPAEVTGGRPRLMFWS
ncbi:MAG: hypothetical protein LQ342_007853 [Letrouitia transgressa]|nr:MAG: hypothetical protein LQ342_007853 [Letrouitia transgressa]